MTWMTETAGDVCTVRSAAVSPCAHPRLVLTTCILASSLAFVDGSVVNVGLPAIGHSLRASAADFALSRFRGTTLIRPTSWRSRLLVIESPSLIGTAGGAAALGRV